MKIRWTGPQVVRRLMGAYEWSQATGFVQEVVDTTLVAELLTNPVYRFAIDVDEELLTLPEVEAHHVAELALAGIGSLADIAALDDAGIARLAAEIWASEKQVWGWVENLTPGP